MKKLLLGAGIGQGSEYKVGKYEVEVDSKALYEIIKKALKLRYSFCGGYILPITHYSALEGIDKMMIIISKLPNWYYPQHKETVIQKLTEIRKSVMASKEAGYEQYAIQRVNT